MTVIEREQTVVEPLVDERERRARVLEAAALEIEVRGWAQGSEGAEPGTGPRCILGGILNACGYDWRVHDYGTAGRVWGADDVDYFQIYGWNDDPERKPSEVTFALRWRAEEIRDGR